MPGRGETETSWGIWGIAACVYAVLVSLLMVILGALIIVSMIFAFKAWNGIVDIKDKTVYFDGYPFKDRGADIDGWLEFCCDKGVIKYRVDYALTPECELNGLFLINTINQLYSAFQPEWIVKLCKVSTVDTAGFIGDAPLCPSANDDCVGTCKYAGKFGGKMELEKDLCWHIRHNIINYNIQTNSSCEVTGAATAALDRTFNIA